MWHMLWPILIVIGANTLYNICTKSTPAEINSFASLAITYALSAVLCLGFFYFTSQEKHLLREISKANWSAFALAFSVVFLEFGYICIYRTGWKVSMASLVANISLACILLFVGVLLYRESISLRQLAGIVVCLFGLFLIGK